MHFNFIFHLAHLKLYANIPTKTSIHIHICICALIGAPFRTSNHSMWSRSSCATNKSFKFYDKTMRNDLKCRQVKKPHKTCWSTAAKYRHTPIPLFVCRVSPKIEALITTIHLSVPVFFMCNISCVSISYKISTTLSPSTAALCLPMNSKSVRTAIKYTEIIMQRYNKSKPHILWFKILRKARQSHCNNGKLLRCIAAYKYENKK